MLNWAFCEYHRIEYHRRDWYSADVDEASLRVLFPSLVANLERWYW
jgi:hypothetical protein